MRRFLILLICVVNLSAAAVESFDSTRPYLKDLKDDQKVKEDTYETPYLYVITAQKFKDPKAVLLANIESYLAKAKLPFKGRYSKEKLPSLKSADQITFPKISFEGKQLEGIQDCKKEYCSVKLLTESEKVKMEGAKDKATLFQYLIVERLLTYFKDGELIGYEERASNLVTLSSSFKYLPFLFARYPRSADFIQNKFFAKKSPDPKDPVQSSLLRMEVMNMSGEKMQPVLRFSEVLKFEENQTTLLFEPQLYTNHFFDSSMRFFEVMAYPDPEYKSLLILTDVMEVDELKKSGIIRALFKGRMVQGIEQYQADEIGRIIGEGVK